MAGFQFGFDKASLGFRGIGEGVGDVEAIRLKWRLGFEIPCILRVAMEREGVERGGARGHGFRGGDEIKENCVTDGDKRGWIGG